jgi:hypothetical protein
MGVARRGTQNIVNLDGVCDLDKGREGSELRCQSACGTSDVMRMAVIGPINRGPCNSVSTLTTCFRHLVRRRFPVDRLCSAVMLTSLLTSSNSLAPPVHGRVGFSECPSPLAPLMRLLKRAAELRRVGVTPSLPPFQTELMLMFINGPLCDQVSGSRRVAAGERACSGTQG